MPLKYWPLDPELAWAANRRFLDRAIARGDEFQLATHVKDADPGSFFQLEIDYILGTDLYATADDGMSIIPKGAGG